MGDDEREDRPQAEEAQECALLLLLLTMLRLLVVAMQGETIWLLQIAVVAVVDP